MKKIGLYGNFNDNIKKIFMDLRPSESEIIDVSNPEDSKRIEEVEYLINRSFALDPASIERFKNLKFIQKWGVGYDKIDTKYAGEKNIPVAICVGVNSQPVAELAVLHMLALYRNLIDQHQKMKENIWAKEEYATKSYMINGKTVGVIGIGSIGRKLGNIVKGFGARVIYYDMHRLPIEVEEKIGFEYYDFEDLISESDIISLHLPLLESTKNLIDMNCLKKMKSSAIIINTARGGIINEDDLVKALQTNVIAGAGLDTFAQEPLQKESELLLFNNVVLTPHCGGNTADNEINMVKCCLENIVKYESGEELTRNSIINKNYLLL